MYCGVPSQRRPDTKGLAGGSRRIRPKPHHFHARGLTVCVPNKKIGWGYLSGPEPHLGGRTIDEKMGKVIGGSSSINAMIYNRGNPMDYDGWADDDLLDWDYAHCLPYFRKMETWAFGANEWRGGDGPMQISRCRAEQKLYAAFLRGGAQTGVT